MPTPDDLTPEAFARLTALEQSQELLRRAQFLDASSRARQAEALDRHEAMHVEHVHRLASLEDMLLRQQELQKSLRQLMVDMSARMTQNETRIAQNEAMLQRLIDLQRQRNGH